jgi:hypothetical protein
VAAEVDEAILVVAAVVVDEAVSAAETATDSPLC